MPNALTVPSRKEEFIEFHKDLLFQDIDAFNDKLLDYLIWFNEQRPHYALNLLSPMQFLKQHHLCNMYWRNTSVLKTSRISDIMHDSTKSV